MTSTTKTMTESAEEYLTLRRGLGFQLQTEGQLVLKFAAFADREHSGSVTTQLALRWACLPEGASPLYCARRLEIVRCFTRFLAIFDEGTEIPPQGLLGRAHRRIAPHIYSDREISDLIAAAGQLLSHGGLRPRTFQTLFGILASTGLRISEALALQTSSLDHDQQLFVVEATKFRKSRLVPLHPTVAAKSSPILVSVTRNCRWPNPARCSSRIGALLSSIQPCGVRSGPCVSNLAGGQTADGSDHGCMTFGIPSPVDVYFSGIVTASRSIMLFHRCPPTWDTFG